jgi:asparagine synthase (glutamine-hydrolysing)
VCGIAGIWRARDGRETVAAMLAAMAHRGPDGSGTVAFTGGAAGMVRLALVDLSPRGQQPLYSPDRQVAILFNGEIYNYRAERDRLEARYPFQTSTDTEVILALYLEDEERFVERLRGMYACAILDWRRGGAENPPELVLVRGPLGVKPLYIAERDGAVLFSSELKGLLASGLVAPQVDPLAVEDYLQVGFVIQPRTILRDVRMLLPGTIERHRAGHPLERRRYWRMPAHQPRRESLDQAAERLRATLEDSVALHSLADAPVGAFLSGGVDSTAIVAMMRRHIPRLRTYTLRFPELPGADEADHAVETARTLGCEIDVVDVHGDEVARLLPRFAGDLDQPSVDGLNTWLISRRAARDVKAVLSGLGGDEFFAGYPVARRMTWTGRTAPGRAVGVAARMAHAAMPYLPGSLRDRADGLAARRSLRALWLRGRRIFTPDAVGRLTGRGAPPEDTHLPLLEEWAPRWREETPVGLCCLLDTSTYMGCQLLRDSDATSMAHSLELRVPFVDIEIARFSRSCQDDYKLKPGGGSGLAYGESGSKRVLVHALRDLLPAGMTARPKRGFVIPIEQWMKGPLAGITAQATSPETVKQRGLLDPATVAAEAQEGAGFLQRWSLVVLELWAQSLLDQARVTPRPMVEIAS